MLYVACLEVACNARHERRLVTNWEHNLSVKPQSLAIAADDSVTIVVVGEVGGNLWPEQSMNQSADDVWLVHDAGEGYVCLVNDFTGLCLDADNGKLNLDSSSSRAALDKRWELRCVEDKLTICGVRFDGFES